MFLGKGTRNALNEYRNKKLKEYLELKNVHCTSVTRKDFPDPRKKDAFSEALKISAVDALISALVLAVLYYVFDHYYSAAGTEIIYLILFAVFFGVFLGYDLFKYHRHRMTVMEYLEKEQKR